MRFPALAAAGLAAAAVVAPSSASTPTEGPGAPPAPALTRDPASGIAEAVLPNGLKVLVLERPGIPVVSHQVWYRVGSVDEKPGETGLAHYLEHVMFKGTKQIRKGQIDLVTFRGGGANNATTWNDFTRYYFNFEASRWRLALEIESDRMRNCAFEPPEFEMERGAVMNEMLAGHDSPGGRLDEEVDAAGYAVHPYHHPTIGWQQEVESVPRSRVIDFYDRHYMPNNATLVVVGDVKAEEVVAAAAAAFADVRPGTLPPPVAEVEPPQRGEKRLVIVEDTETPKVMVAWHTCRVGDDEDYAFDVASTVLGGGKSSRLYRRLVETDRSCTDVSVFNESRKFPGRFKAWAEGQESADPRAIEAAILDEVARFAVEGPSERELEKAKNNILAHDVYARETADGMAERIGYLETVRSWRIFGEYPDRIRKVTAAEVRAAAARWLTARNRTVGWSIAPALSGLATPAAKAPTVEEARAATAAAPPPLDPAAARKPEVPAEPGVSATFRGGRTRALDLAIPAGNAGRVRIEPQVHRLENGMTVLLLPRPGLPVLAFSLYVDAGQLREAKPGLAYIVGDLLDEGAGDRSSAEIAETLDFLGAALGTGPSGARARCLSKDADQVLGLLADVVMRPRFEPAELEKVRAAVLSEIAAEEDDPTTQARKGFLKEVYGAHPWGRLPRGDRESVAAITRDDVLAHWKAFHAPASAILAVTGDFEAGAMLSRVKQRFGAWAGGGPRVPPLPALAAATKPVAKTIRLPDKQQCNLFVGNLGLRRKDPDYIPVLVMDHVLGTGPGFTDRLSKDLRDGQGLAYTVYARCAASAGEEPGTFTAFIGCSPADLPRAREGIFGHLRRIREEPVTEEELRDAQSYLTGSQVFRYETTEQLAGILVDLHRFGLGFDYPERFPALVNAVTREDVQRVARKYVLPDVAVTVVSGPVP